MVAGTSNIKNQNTKLKFFTYSSYMTSARKGRGIGVLPDSDLIRIIGQSLLFFFRESGMVSVKFLYLQTDVIC